MDQPTTPLPFPAEVIVARGPFDVAGDTALLQKHGIEVIVAKNAGGKGAVAKIAAARALGLAIVMIDRPQITPRKVTHGVAGVMAWLNS